VKDLVEALGPGVVMFLIVALALAFNYVTSALFDALDKRANAKRYAQARVEQIKKDLPTLRRIRKLLEK
jgi:uncharacterized membrane protein